MKKSLLLSMVIVLSGTLSAQLKFNHTFDQADFDDPMVCVNTVETMAFSGTTLSLKKAYSSLLSWGDAFNWNQSYMDVALEGAPLNIDFEIAYNTPTKMKLDVLKIFDDGQGYILPTVGGMDQSSDLGKAMFWLAESADGVTYTTTYSWRHSANEVYNCKSSYGFLHKSVRLKETTRYVRLGYRANFQGQYKNIIVTPLHTDVQLEVNPHTLDFGRMHANTTDHTDDKSMELDAYWRNVKNITLEVKKYDSDAAKGMYTVTKTQLGTSEINTGSDIVNVTNNPNAAVGEYKVSKDTKTGAIVHIHAATQYTNDERIRNIPLSVVLCKDKRTITWYEGMDTVYVGQNVTLEKATISSGTVKYQKLYTNGTADINTSTLKTNDGIGIVQMEAYCDGTGNYADASEVRTFVVLPEHGSLYEASLCEGDVIEVGGKTIKAEMGKTYEIVTLGDSTIFVDMSVHPVRKDAKDAVKVAEYDLPFTWEGLTFTEAGSQTATLQSRYGCDSVVTMTLSVMPTYYKTDTVCVDKFPICWRHYLGKEDSKDIYDTIHIFHTYETATHVFTTASGDSAMQYKVVPYDTIFMTPDYRTICQGDSTLWRAQYYKETGVYTSDSTNTCGTPVVCSLNLTVLAPTYAPTEDTAICAADTATFEWHGQSYVTGKAIYTDTAHYEAGCDSVYYSLNLTVLMPTMAPTEDSTICAADTAAFEWHGKKYVTGQTVYLDTAYYKSGCDSVYYQLNLTVLMPTTTPAEDSTICAADTVAFEWHGKKYVTGQTVYLDTAYYKSGCDSVYYQLNLKVQSPTTVPMMRNTICAADTSSFKWHGQKYVSGKAVYYDTIQYAATGCDSAYYSLTLTVLYPTQADKETDTICAMDTATFVWHGHPYEPGKTVYYDTAYYEAGCDSAYYELHLTMLSPTAVVPEYTAICAKDTASFEWRGKKYVTGQTEYRDTAYYANGCDSVYYTMYLTVHPSGASDTVASACNSFTWYGTKYTTTGDYKETFTTIHGCDSVVTLHLTIYQSVTSEFADTTCPAKPYVWEGDTYTKSGDYTKTLTTSMGCDSVVTLHLLVATPNPDLHPALDQIPASNKYDAWLLMLDKGAVEDTYHLTPKESDVSWYRVVGEIDSQMDDAVKDDEKVGQGFYYTNDRRLTGTYYALLTVPAESTEDKCGAVYRSVVLNASQKQPLRLVPSYVTANEPMHLINVDESSTTIRVYNSTGQLLNTICSEQTSTVDIKAEKTVGMYLIKVQNEHQDETLKYVVGK